MFPNTSTHNAFKQDNLLNVSFNVNIQNKISSEHHSFTIASAIVIYVYLVISMGACSIRACSISKLLTPQQQCLLLFILKLPVDQATSKIPPLRERC